MQAFLHQLLSGLANGGIYASVALALVMIYQATHLVNFAQGEMAMFSTYVAWAMLDAGFPYWAAFGLTLVFSFIAGVAIERIIIRPVERGPALTIVIVFIGLLLILNSLAGWIFSYTIKSFPSPFPSTAWYGSKYMSSHEVGMIVVTLAVLILVFLFFRFTPLGLAMRAAAQNPVSSRLVGIRVGWMLAFGWGLAGAIGAVAGMMAAPIVYLDPNMMSGILLYGFAGALLGGIDNPWGAALGGFFVGVLENIAGAYVVGTELKLTVALVIIVGVLVLQTRRSLRSNPGHASMMMTTPNEKPSVEPAAYAGLSPAIWQYVGIAAILAIACILPFAVSGYRVSQFSQVLIYAIAMLGLNILTGFNGQISLGQGAFYGIGAYTTAILLDKTAIPYWATVPIAGAICLGAGFLFGLPALRLEGLYLALATLALAVATPQILKFKGFDHWTGGVQGIQVDPPAAPFGLPLNTDRWIYYFCLIWTIALFIIARNLLRGRTGRAMIAIRDHPLAAATMGVDTALYKSLTFGVSAMYTGIAGALGALLSAYVSPDSFPVLLSIKFLVGSVVGGIVSISGVFIGALFIEFTPNFADQISKAAPDAIFGMFLIALMYLMPKGAIGVLDFIGVQLRRVAVAKRQN